MPNGTGFRNARLQDISREIAYLTTEAEQKRRASVEAYYRNPELAERLMEEAVRLETAVNDLTLLQLNYKQNPLVVETPVVHTPLFQRFRTWLKSKLGP